MRKFILNYFKAAALPAGDYCVMRYHPDLSGVLPSTREVFLRRLGKD